MLVGLLLLFNRLDYPWAFTTLYSTHNVGKLLQLTPATFSTRSWNTTPFYNRFILEMPFIQPNIMCMSVLIPGATYHQGDSFEMTHAVMGFSEHEFTDKITTIVDLSTMQFGESGRGMGGKGLVVIESLEEFYGRVQVSTLVTVTRVLNIVRQIGASRMWSLHRID